LSFNWRSLLNEVDDTPEGVGAVVIARAASILFAGTIPALMRASMKVESVGADTGVPAEGVVVKNEAARAAMFEATLRADEPELEVCVTTTGSAQEDVVNERTEPYEAPVVFVEYGRK
jgi:hypothetical protein